MRVYEKVRAYIDEMGYKQVTIAEKAGIPKATFNAILNGKRTLYSSTKLFVYHSKTRPAGRGNRHVMGRQKCHCFL